MDHVLGRISIFRIMVSKMKNSMYTVLLPVLYFLIVPDGVKGQNLERVSYNNPGLVSDLGVGLWAWPLPMDYDHDGDNDLLVSCRDVPFRGLYFFENKEGTAFPAFEPPVRIGDPIKDIQMSIVNGKPRFLKPGEELLGLTSGETSHLFDPDIFDKLHEKIRFNQWKYVDYENDGDLDIVVGIQDGADYGWDNAFNEEGVWVNGPLHGLVYLFENEGGTYRMKGKIEAGGKPIDVYGAPSPNFDDYDNDGDLDIICGEFLDRFTWFENIGTRENPQYAEGRFLMNDTDTLKMDLEMIIPVSIDWDQDGDVDLIVGDEDGRVAFVENTGHVDKGMPVFEHPKYFKQKAAGLKFGALVTPFSVDWDDDGDEDLICGNTAGHIGFIENLGGGENPIWKSPVLLTADDEIIRIQAGYNGSIQGPCEAKWGYTTLSVADWNHDGLKDVIANSIWGKIVWFENVGSRGKPQLTAAKDVRVDWEGTPPKPDWFWWTPEPKTLATQWRTTPTAIDWNEDGLMDLVMLDTEGYLSFYERKQEGGRTILKPGERIFHSVNGTYDRKNNKLSDENGPLQLSEALYGSSGRRKLAFGDWDGDGDIDMVANGINAVLWENVSTSEGKVYFEFKGDLSDQKLAGHTTSPTFVDWDKDGVLDLLLGAEDGFFYYLRRSQKK